MARTRTPSRDLEQALLTAAEAVLIRDGVAGLTVRAVAAEAGVAPMGVYSRFGSKDGLLAAMIKRSFDLLHAALVDGQVDARVDDTDVLGRLRAAGWAYRGFALGQPAHYQLIFGVQPEQDIALGPEVEASAEAAFTSLEDLVRAALGAGAFAPADAADVAQQIWDVVHGAVSLELAGRIQTEDAAATYGRLLETLLRGLAPVAPPLPG